MSNGEAQPRDVIGRGPVRASGDIIQPRRARRRNEEWALLVLHHFPHCVVRPQRECAISSPPRTAVDGRTGAD